MTLLDVALLLSGLMLAAAVALDLLGLLAVSATGLVAIAGGHLALLDIALGLGLVGFVGAVGIAAFIERAARPPEGEDG